MKKISIIDGPNINFFGQREPEIYGSQSYEEIKKQTINFAKNNQLSIDWQQSQSEGQIVEFIHDSTKDSTALILNPGAFSHTSIAIYDALKIISFFKVEVHLSQLYKRGLFRTQLLTAKSVDMVITGAGSLSYKLALMAILERKE